MLVILPIFKMKYIFFFLSMLTIITLGACDMKHPPKEVNEDLYYDVLPDYNSTNTTAPYDFSKYKALLDQANYQYPHATTIARIGGYENFKTPQFYATQDGDLYFQLDKEFNTIKERSELRQVVIDSQSGEYNTSAGWHTSSSEGNFWIADIHCFKPQYTQSYTWMQIHGIDGATITLSDGSNVPTFNYPLLRLTWQRSRTSIYDHIWAVIISSYPRTPKEYLWVDLGKRPDGFFHTQVSLQNNILQISINDTVMISYDVTYWEEEPNYFKAGIYINNFDDGGKAAIAYRELRFEDNASKI
ncbi:polysaccharide lyase family 7 protein [Sulfurimonas sp.]|uniref:polysaccharide lyase family 7 protein n=1 Tax=Sulfurimonas sp. TaxID=2022749 RepID=UPI002637E415|nr:polysaccharide lyase family 7 protein [Sulfurimonas sp.]